MPIDDLRYTIEESLSRAIENARAKGVLDIPPFQPAIEVPRNASHGDFSTGAAMSLAKIAHRSPREVAAAILDHLDPPEGYLSAPPEIVGPGFINFRISPDVWHGAIKRILDAGEKYGQTDVGGGERVLIEFVSANPTGPLHIGHARGAAMGDSLARILDAAGYDVQREFYINDAGVQVDILAKSVHCRYLELLGNKIDWEKTFPEGNYYPGDYVQQLARLIESEKSDAFADVPPGEFDAEEGIFVRDQMIDGMRSDLEAFRVEFDNWFSETDDLFNKGLVTDAFNELRERGDIYEKDNALWFKVSKYQHQEEDRVIRKSSGEGTYFASDIAYHRDKLRRGFERLVNIWGADHHGYIGRVKASLEALGLAPDKLQILLVQMVNLVRDGEPVRMGKRSGEFVTLKEMMEEVGTDAMRFTFLTRGGASHLDFDIDALKAKPGEDSEMKISQLREKKPVYYVQYAHARSRSIFRKAEEKGADPEAHLDADLSRLTHPEEIDLARKIESFPREVATAATSAEPHRISHYLIELAGDFHRYYYRGDRNTSYRVITDDESTRAARLALVAAVAQVISNGLELLGVEAPERM